MMKLFALLILFQTFWVAGFAQSLPFPNKGAILQRTNLVVRWKASKHPWPKTLWTYQMVPNNFSPMAVSYLMAIGSFTEKDKIVSDTNGVFFGNLYGDPNLRISFTEGEINYSRVSHGPITNLVTDMPGTNQIFQSTTNLLSKLGISLSELVKTKDGKPAINFFTHEFYTPPTNTTDSTITNVETVGTYFHRQIDGVKVWIGGEGQIDFNRDGQISGIMLMWRGVKHDKLYAAATPKQIIQWIREGKAALPKGILGGMGSMIPIDWSTVKKVTIKKATAYYWGEFFLGEREHRPIFPSPVIPYAVLQATIDTGTTNIDVQISCPIIDETKPLKVNP
ncbi:MAG: hypothetical protein ACREFE_19145 [Limisphaerales bacterium]